MNEDSEHRKSFVEILSKLQSCTVSFNMPSFFPHSNYVLHIKEDISDGIGAPDWRLTLCLLFSWVVLFFTLAWGVKSSGKVRLASFPCSTRNPCIYKPQLLCGLLQYQAPVTNTLQRLLLPFLVITLLPCLLPCCCALRL